MTTKNRSTKFVYLYRDASNYKQWGHVTFANLDGFEVHDLDRRLRHAMMIDSTFIADQIRVPEVFLFNTASMNHDDHCLHEFDSLETVDERPNDKQQRSIAEFVREVEHVAAVGWEGFDPELTAATVQRFKLLL
jgi:hypothetical protein